MPKQHDELNKNSVGTELVAEINLDCTVGEMAKICKHCFRSWKEANYVRLFTFGQFPCVILAKNKKLFKPRIHFILNFTCHAEQNPSQGHPARLLGLLQEFEHVHGIECHVNLGVPFDDIVHAECAHADQPGQNYRSEEKPDAVGAVMLESEQEHYYGTCYRSDGICMKATTRRRNEHGRTSEVSNR